VLLKPSFLIGAIVGYVLGARAGRERYEDIVALARRIAGSQTVQATAGVVQAQVDEATARMKVRLTAKLPKSPHTTVSNGRVNGSH